MGKKNLAREASRKEKGGIKDFTLDIDKNKSHNTELSALSRREFTRLLINSV